MKKTILWFLALLLVGSIVALPAFADCDKHGKQCSLSGDKSECGKGDCDKSDCGSCSECPIQNKIMKKAKFFLKNQKEIGLSEEQVAQIKAIKLNTKKTALRQSAEMDIFKMELDAKLSDTKLDTAAIDAMLDQASGGWGAGDKASVAEYAKLKAVLNEQQMAKAKEIWMKDKA